MKDIGVREFIRELHLMANQESRFAFFIGAGCSQSSGIPTASKLVKIWLTQLKRKKTGNSQGIEKWITNYFEEYDGNNLGKLYAKVINELFPHAKSRQQEIERWTEARIPFLGYALLATLMGDSKFSEQFNMILTTNFDDLIADALYLYTNKRPRVISHESLVSFASSSSKKPHVIKLHGDAQFDPKNTSEETNKLSLEVESVLKEILSERGIIFLGYGGNDNSIIKLFSKLGERSLQWGIYWVSQTLPDPELSKWLDQRKATWVKHRDFDEFMLLLSKEFGIKSLDSSKLEVRFKTMMDSNDEAIKKIQEKILDKPESEEKINLNEALEEVIEDKEDWFKLALMANEKAKNNFANAEKLYQDGMQKFGNDPAFLALMGNFYHEYEKYPKAIECYKKSLDIYPQNSSVLNNIGLALNYIGKLEDALDYFTKSLKIVPNNAAVLHNYGLALSNLGKYEEARFYMNKALTIEPNNPLGLSNMGSNLKEMGKYEEALEYFNKALEIDQNNALAMLHTGVTLGLLDRKNEAKTYFNKILNIQHNQLFLDYCKGKSLLYLQRPQEALTYFDNGLLNNPYDIPTLCEKGIAFIRLEQYENALKCLNEALTIRDDVPKVYYCFAILYDAKNNMSEVKKYLKKSLEVDKWYKTQINLSDFKNIKNKKELDDLLN